MAWVEENPPTISPGYRINRDLIMHIPSEYSSISEALALLGNKAISTSNIVTIKVATGSYIYTAPIEITYRYAPQLRIIGSITQPDRCALIFNPPGQYKCHGFYLHHGTSLLELNGFTILGKGRNPSDLHAFGVFAYYNSSVWCGPEYPDIALAGSGTKLRISGFVSGLCASKNSSIMADGVKCTALLHNNDYYRNTSGVFAAHGGTIEFRKGEATGSSGRPNSLTNPGADLLTYMGIINAYKATYGTYKQYYTTGAIIDRNGTEI